MRIRDEQIAGIRSAQSESFESRVLEYLRRWYPQDVRSRGGPEFRAFFDLATRKAETYSVDREIDRMRFVEVLLAIGTDFDETPGEVGWAQEILTYPVPAESRLDRICERLRFGP